MRIEWAGSPVGMQRWMKINIWSVNGMKWLHHKKIELFILSRAVILPMARFFLE